MNTSYSRSMLPFKCQPFKIQRAPVLHNRSARVIPRAEAQAAQKGAYPRWDVMWKDLTEKYDLNSISPQEADSMIKAGKAVMVDVRMSADYEKSRIPGSVNVPAFILIELTKGGNSFATILKGMAYMANGVTPTDNNPNLLKGLQDAAGDKAIIVACEAGGTLLPSTNFATGKVSRSLKAAWKALSSGTLSAERVFHLDGGVLNYWKSGLPMEGEYDPTMAYRSPNSVQDDVKKN